MNYGSDIGRHRNFSYVSMYTPLNILTQERILPISVPVKEHHDTNTRMHSERDIKRVSKWERILRFKLNRAKVRIQKKDAGAKSSHPRF